MTCCVVLVPVDAPKISPYEDDPSTLARLVPTPSQYSSEKCIIFHAKSTGDDTTGESGAVSAGAEAIGVV